MFSLSELPTVPILLIPLSCDQDVLTNSSTSQCPTLNLDLESYVQLSANHPYRRMLIYPTLLPKQISSLVLILPKFVRVLVRWPFVKKSNVTLNVGVCVKKLERIWRTRTRMSLRIPCPRSFPVTLRLLFAMLVD